MKKPPHLRSRQRRGRWFHTYRRDDREISLDVHGLHPTDPRVFAAYCAEHARWEHAAREAKRPSSGTFAWGVDLYKAGPHWGTLEQSTQGARDSILRRYLASQGDRPLESITAEAMEAALTARGGFAPGNELKALKPVFAYLKKLRLIPIDPTAGLKLDKPPSDGFPVADAEDIARFMERWPVGTVERLGFDLALYTGAARADLVKLSRRNVGPDLLTYTRQKSKVKAEVPLTHELRAVIARTPDIAPAFLLTAFGKPFTAAGFGNKFGDAAEAAEMVARLHGLRKAFCVYWAEKGASTHTLMAMAGHLTLAEVERYTRAADRTRLVKLLVEGA